MRNLILHEKIAIYKNLFKGRDDIFAVYWEKADKSNSGYTPVCLNEWKSGICIKLNKGKCRDCRDQKYATISDFYIEQHLRGHKTYGIYPLLKDNTSYFVAADFDGKKWEKDSAKFIKKCSSYDLPAYAEKSRSGNGGHVWLFFTDKYPAYKSRNIAIDILKEAKIIDQYTKEDSFDRLFPNQDSLSGKGFGNLIALPLQGEARKYNNTVFLDPENGLRPFTEQWDFLQQVEKISLEKLDQLYKKLNKETKSARSKSKISLTITIKGQIYISKENLPTILVDFLKENLNFVNSEYLIKKKIGLSVYGMERYFKLIQTNGSNITIPRGFLKELTNFLDEHNIRFELINECNKLEPIKIESELNLHDYQLEAIESMLMSENGILVAPPGSGKTIIGIDLITKREQPALILVHKKQIFDQWLERIESFLNIPKRKIGQLCSNKKKVGDRITVAMVQTLNKMDNIRSISDKYGMIIVDECHHMPAKMFRKVIKKFNPYYLYGLTATPERKNNDAKLIFAFLGDILHTIDNNFNKIDSTHTVKPETTSNQPNIVIRDTDLDIPFKVKTDNFHVLSKIIIFDSKRNRQIVVDIKENVNKGLKCLVLTERKEHVDVLSYYLKRENEIITLTGDLTEKKKKEKIKQIRSGNFQVLLATGQLIGEGTDFPSLDCLFLVYPFAFSGKLTQYIGRIQRGTYKNKFIYDYRDVKAEYLEKLYKKRLKYYKKNFGGVT
jgi:superfamily II DNA or RNA helicase